MAAWSDLPHQSSVVLRRWLRANPSFGARCGRKCARGRVRARSATPALGAWQRLGVSRHGAVGLLPRMWTLKDNVSAYDATYVALAEALDCPLLTADARLAAAAGIRCPVVTVRT